MFSDDISLYQSFYLDWREAARISSICDERISFVSDNDPYVSFDDLKKFCNSICAKEIFTAGSGHFNEKSRYLEFKELLSYI